MKTPIAEWNWIQTTYASSSDTFSISVFPFHARAVFSVLICFFFSYKSVLMTKYTLKEQSSNLSNEIPFIVSNFACSAVRPKLAF